MKNKKRKYWTDDEREKLKGLYPTALGKDLAKIFNCTLSSIYNQAERLGLKKDLGFIADVARKNAMNPNHGGRKFLFQKGQIPPNKGKKQTEFMSDESIERTKKTRFKKGNIPVNHRQVGSERFDKDGYIMIKIADPNKWKLKHRYIWEQKNGNIPKGYNIQFKDGNKHNCEIENLYMISRAKQMETENSASLNLPDSIVALYIAGKKGQDKALIEELKKHPDLLSIKRNQLLLNRKIKEYESSNN